MTAATAGAPASYSHRYVVVVALFVSCLIAANVIAIKIVSVAGLTLSAAIVIFPVSYILGDVLTEVYGFARARSVIWLGFAGNVLTVAAIWLAGLLPAAPFWPDQAAYDAILGATPRILVASFIAYLIGEFANAYLLAKMKVATAGRHLWARTIGSTLVGQGFDTLVFLVVAFAGVIPAPALLGSILTQWLAKSSYEALATPITYIVVNYLKRADRSDVYDRDTRFTPIG
ncbi:MAG: VUT family protein [Alphaproteobacteria bacterium]|nr:VUT family protein [Alphaproteobacteria bacterium]